MIVNKTIYNEVSDVIKGRTEYDYQTISSQGRMVGYYPGERHSEHIRHIYNFSHGYISTRITKEKLQIMLNKRSPAIVIDAQTGSGKTTLITDVCYPIIKEKHKKLLVLSNRTLIKNKIKFDVIKKIYPEILELLTNKGIEKEHHFGDVDIYTYQDFMGDFNYFKNRKSFEEALNEYGIVIFDEVHFFISDATFNPYTMEIMEYLLSNCITNEIPRIYMSGTMDPILNIIYEKENQLKDNRLNAWGIESQNFYYCHFDRDYQYIDMKQFKNDAELAGKINQSKDKWLIFIDKKSRADNLKSQIKKKKVVNICSENINDPDSKEEVCTIIDTDEMEADILITTTVMDVGINIKNPLNIVSYLNEKSSFIQALGRKRVKKRERVTVYIPRYTVKNVNKWLSICKKEINQIIEDQEQYPEASFANGCQIPQSAIILNGRYKYNTMAEYYYHCYQEDWKQVINYILENPNLNAEDIIYSHFMDWIDQSFKKVNAKNSENELEKIIEKYSKENMDQKRFKDLCEELKPFDVRKDQRRDRVELSTRSVNNIINPLGYKMDVQREGTDKKYKIISRKDG